MQNISYDDDSSCHRCTISFVAFSRSRFPHVLFTAAPRQKTFPFVTNITKICTRKSNPIYGETFLHHSLRHAWLFKIHCDEKCLSIDESICFACRVCVWEREREDEFTFFLLLSTRCVELSLHPILTLSLTLVPRLSLSVHILFFLLN